jgi:Domain of unknown function (DUF4439)
MGPVDAELDALQTTLAAEHAAVYVFGLLGSRTSQTAEAPLYQALRAAYEVHRERRDTLVGEIAAAGGTPVPAAAAYTPPSGLDTTDGRYQAALALERGCASTYAALVGATTGASRTEAIGFLNDAAARELSFRGIPEIFPGADEYADR